jgi:hypothetical protein
MTASGRSILKTAIARRRGKLDALAKECGISPAGLELWASSDRVQLTARALDLLCRRLFGPSSSYDPIDDTVIIHRSGRSETITAIRPGQDDK